MVDEASFSNDARPHSEALDPFSAADAALEIQTEKLRAKEALSARDTAIQHLADACASLRQKSELIVRLQKHQCQDGSETRASMSTSPRLVEMPLELMVEKTQLTNEIMELQCAKDKLQAELKKMDDSLTLLTNTMPNTPIIPTLPLLSRNPSFCSSVSNSGDIEYGLSPSLLKTGDAAEIIRARNEILAGLPLPEDIPEDALRPIVIPPPFTLHEFLGNASGSLRSSLSNYRVFQQITTSWCPDREEHGYMLTPLFKCSTNPRVATAHRWMPVDVVGRMNKPAECFYNKDGKWYYAGVYKPIRLDNLTTKEWDALSPEATQAIIKDTIAGRKNTSPQNVYETSQLYAAGALKVACVGLQCIGFNAPMYRAILEQANKCAQNGKWKTNPSSVGMGLGSRGATWNRDVADDMSAMQLEKRSADGTENRPVEQRSLRAK